MTSTLLISNKYKVFGWILFIFFGGFYTTASMFELKIPAINWDFLSSSSLLSSTDITDEILLTLTMAGLLMICFSKEKHEDEYISFLRLKSWQAAVLISYGVLFVATWTIYGGAFLTFMVYNMFTVLFVFIIKFNYSLYRLKKEGQKNEK